MTLPPDDMTLDPTVPPESTADAADGLPQRIGPYRIEGLLGRGGMGEVYRAFDEGLRRHIAVKRVVTGQRDRAEARARFWREARALAALDHPGIVRVHRIDETDSGELYLAMELVDGEPLAASLGQPWPSSAVAAIGRQAAAALAVAHRAGMTHRDVKPANLLLQTDGQIRVVDFGLARRAEAIEDRVTATGARIGTPAYMAPEQVSGQPVGPPADVFALGVVLYRALTGRHPFARDSAEATALALASGSHPPIAEIVPLADAQLCRVIERCLQPDLTVRHPDAAAVLDALAPVPALSPTELAEFAADQDAAEHAWSTSGPIAPSLPTTPSTPNWPLRIVIGTMVVALAVWLGLRPEPTDTPQPAPTQAQGAPTPVTNLPPRPVVAVTGFAAPGDDPEDPRAAVLADAVRSTLTLAPEALVAVPWLALAHTLAADEPIDATLNPKRLTRPGRRLGHVDLVVRGTLEEADAGRLRVRVELVDTLTQKVRRAWSLSGPADAIAMGTVVGRAVAQTLGVQLPENTPMPTRSVSAWGAVLNERKALRRGAFEDAERSLEWALQLDPHGVQARLDELALLRARREKKVLKTRVDALLARADLSARQRLLAQAWQARANGDGPSAIRVLARLLDQWPFDVAAYDLLMSLRSYDPLVRDNQALEQLARGVLAIAPRHETAASRLVRVLNAQDRLDDAEQVLTAINLPRDDPAMADLWAELDLYQGRFPQALAGFRAALRRSPDDIYSTHMALAAQILMGTCDAAAVDALNRIQRVEDQGMNNNLDWTYSLAVQALICRAQWDSLDTVMARWEKHSQSGRDQVASLRPRLAILKDRSPTALADTLEKQLENKEIPVRVRHDLLRVLARVSTDADDLRRRAKAAEATALRPQTPAPIRKAWLRAQRLLALRAQLLTDETAALKTLTQSRIQGPSLDNESDFSQSMEGLAFEAEALEFAGKSRQAEPIWEKIRTAGYRRLYTTDLWILAQRRAQ